MTPLKQTKLHDAEAGVKGNCMATAFASLLDLPLDQVPQFEELENHE